MTKDALFAEGQSDASDTTSSKEAGGGANQKSGDVGVGSVSTITEAIKVFTMGTLNLILHS